MANSNNSDNKILRNQKLIADNISVASCKSCTQFTYVSGIVGCKLYIPDETICIILINEKQHG